MSELDDKEWDDGVQCTTIERKLVDTDTVASFLVELEAQIELECRDNKTWRESINYSCSFTSWVLVHWMVWLISIEACKNKPRYRSIYTKRKYSAYVRF